MAFYKKLLWFMLVDVVFFLMSVSFLNTWGFSKNAALVVVVAGPTAITALVARALYQRRERRIWYMPLSQAALFAGVCLFLIVQDALGYRSSSAWLDLGVGFDIAVLGIIASFWIVPALIAAVVYRVMADRRFW